MQTGGYSFHIRTFYIQSKKLRSSCYSTVLSIKRKSEVGVVLINAHMYSTLKSSGNGCFRVLSTWNKHGVFLGFS